MTQPDCNSNEDPLARYRNADGPTELTEHRLIGNMEKLRNVRKQMLELKAQEADIQTGIRQDCETLERMVQEVRAETNLSTSEKPSEQAPIPKTTTHMERLSLENNR